MLLNKRVMVPLRQRKAEVVQIIDLSPTMRRIRLVGDDLSGFETDPLAPEAHIKVFFPERGAALKMPKVLEDGSADWHGAAEGRFSPFRDYTVRAFDKDKKQLDIDFVLHDEGVGGPWAQHAKIGDELGIFGPRSLKIPPLNADNYVFFVDETSLPALSRWMEILPPNVQVNAWIEVDNDRSKIDLIGGERRHFHWLYRDDSSTEYGELLYLAVTELPILLLSKNTWLWAATEAHVISNMKRRLMMLTSLLNPAHIDLVAYWKRTE